MKLLLNFLRPNRVNIMLLLILILISSIVATGIEWTSKVNWHAHRGFPFPFMIINEYVQGGYCPHNNICLATNIQNLNPFAMLLDILLCYFIICTVVFVYETIKMKNKSKKYFS